MIRRLSAAAVFSAVVSIAWPCLAGDRTVAAFFNPEIRPYRAVLDGFKESCGCSVVEYPVRKGEARDYSALFGAGKPDLLLTIGLDARLAAREIRNLPIISTMVPRAQALPAAGSNLVGIDMTLAPERYLATMRRLFPAAKRIGVLYDPENMGDYVGAAARAAAGMGLQLVLREAAGPAAAPALLASLRGEIDLYWMLPDPTVVREETLNALFLFSFENKVPVFGFARKYIEMGALAALAVDPFAIGVQAGEKARTLRGVPTAGAAASWEHIRKSSVVINRKVGKKMGVRFDLEALQEAADVID